MLIFTITTVNRTGLCKMEQIACEENDQTYKKIIKKYWKNGSCPTHAGVSIVYDPVKSRTTTVIKTKTK